jgi:predicted 3-demethylubiquinone-9 3-methyltransferase (glyoxalase superfamily)
MRITPFLMFEGKAEEALRFYLATFPRSALTAITRYAAGEPGAEGTVKHASFSLNGQPFECIDSQVHHGFGFTAALSLSVDCDSEAEIDALFAALAAGGQVLMPLGAYPFGRRYGWLNDRFGVSWQLRLP